MRLPVAIVFCAALAVAAAANPSVDESRPSPDLIKAYSSKNETGGNWMRQFVHDRMVNFTRRLNLTTTPSNKIVGGYQLNSTDNLHPFQVALLSSFYSNDYDAQFCGGTLVSGRYVVTAAHCSDFVDPQYVNVLVGTKTLNKTGKGNRVGVDAIFVHPKYDPWIADYDVAVWRLATNVNNVTVAKLAPRDSNPAAGVNATITGWGLITDNGVRATQLRAAVLKVLNRTVCTSYYGSYAMTNRMLCAGNGTPNTCQGDSGGPLTTRVNATSPWDVLTGITSFGDVCSTSPGVYARVGNPEIYDFIQSTLNDTRILDGWIQSNSYAALDPLSSTTVQSPSCPANRQIKACSFQSSLPSIVGTAFPTIGYKTNTYAMKCTCTLNNFGFGGTGSFNVQCAAYCET